MRLKILRITTISSSLATLLKGQLQFLSNYYEVVGIASGYEGLKIVEDREGIRTIEISMSREIAILRDIKSLFSLILLFCKERPYIVHTNTPKASLLSMIAAYVTRVPHRIYTVTGLRFETTTGMFRCLLVAMEKITCWCATKVIPEGEGVKNTLIREKVTNKPLNIVLNGNINGVDIEYFNRKAILASNIDKNNNHYTFIFVGRLVKDKGINELVLAFAKLQKENPYVRLLLVGPLEKKLDPLDEITLKHIQCLRSIEFVGFQSDIRSYLASSDVLVFPSYREGFPNVVLQAGAMELPSIVTNINGCNEIIKDGVNGKIIPSRDENALYEAMKWFYEHKDDEVKKMANRARPMVVDRYEQHKVWEALLEEYQSLK